MGMCNIIVKVTYILWRTIFLHKSNVKFTPFDNADQLFLLHVWPLAKPVSVSKEIAWNNHDTYILTSNDKI